MILYTLVFWSWSTQSSVTEVMKILFHKNLNKIRRKKHWRQFVIVQMNTLWIVNTYGWLLTIGIWRSIPGTTSFSKVQILNARCGRNPFSWKESDSPLSVSWNGRMLGRGLTTVTETFSVIITIVNVNGKVMHRKWWIVMKRGVPALTSQNISSNLFEIF